MQYNIIIYSVSLIEEYLLHIRDFMYLDIERVRSFFAQISEGLPTERVIEKARERGVATKGSLGVPIVAQGEAEADYRYVRSNTETSSLHDYILEEFLEKLQRAKMIYDLPDQDFDWTTDAFSDGQFFLVKGTLKILDYKYIVNALDNFPKLAKFVARISSLNKSGANPEINKMEKEIRDLPIRDMARFTEENMQDTLRIKVYPDQDKVDQHFVMSANEAFFRSNTVSLINMYGHTINANWSCLLQANLGNDQVLTRPSENLSNPSMGLESAIETIADYFAQMNAMMQGVGFPAVAATPIAIFRDIT